MHYFCLLLWRAVHVMYKVYIVYLKKYLVYILHIKWYIKICSGITSDPAVWHVNIVFQEPNINIAPGLIWAWFLYFLCRLPWLWLCGKANACVVAPLQLHLPFSWPPLVLMWHCHNQVQGTLLAENNSLDLMEQKIPSYQNAWMCSLWARQVYMAGMGSRVAVPALSPTGLGGDSRGGCNLVLVLPLHVYCSEGSRYCCICGVVFVV